MCHWYDNGLLVPDLCTGSNYAIETSINRVLVKSAVSILQDLKERKKIIVHTGIVLRNRDPWIKCRRLSQQSWDHRSMLVVVWLTSSDDVWSGIILLPPSRGRWINCSVLWWELACQIQCSMVEATKVTHSIVTCCRGSLLAHGNYKFSSYLYIYN